VKKLELPDGEAGDLAREYVGWWETDVEGKMLPALDDLRAAITPTISAPFRRPIGESTTSSSRTRTASSAGSAS
jgi:hypothetical protein